MSTSTAVHEHCSTCGEAIGFGAPVAYFNDKRICSTCFLGSEITAELTHLRSEVERLRGALDLVLAWRDYLTPDLSVGLGGAMDSAVTALKETAHD